MTHYEERLEKDLVRLREGVATVGNKVQQALEHAVRALLERDHELAYDTVLGDMPINRDVRAMDRHCHVFVARHLPSSGHLRYVSSVMRLNVALERIGDYAVAISREAVQLTAKEFDLLLHFARYPGRVFTRAQLLDQVWGYGHEGYEHTVNSHINRLRSKIELDPAKPRYILTVWGIGYRFSEASATGGKAES